MDQPSWHEGSSQDDSPPVEGLVPSPDWLRWLAGRWNSTVAFLATGTAAIVTGGLVAAVTGPIDLEDGSWLAAYLVLVGGVAQVALGCGQAVICATEPTCRLSCAEFTAWNLAVAAVVLGTFVDAPYLTSSGGAATVAALVMFLVGTVPSRSGAGRLAIAYRALILIVLVSTPVGLLLAWIRRG